MVTGDRELREALEFKKSNLIDSNKRNSGLNYRRARSLSPQKARHLIENSNLRRNSPSPVPPRSILSNRTKSVQDVYQPYNYLTGHTSNNVYRVASPSQSQRSTSPYLEKRVTSPIVQYFSDHPDQYSGQGVLFIVSFA